MRETISIWTFFPLKEEEKTKERKNSTTVWLRRLAFLIARRRRADEVGGEPMLYLPLYLYSRAKVSCPAIAVLGDDGFLDGTPEAILRQRKFDEKA